MHIQNFTVEEFKGKKDLDYIPVRLDTNVLNCLCSELTLKTEIAKSVVLSVKKRESEYFLTDFHVRWALECIGYSFSLPSSQNSTIAQAISIYTAWLVFPAKRPEFISLNDIFYQREMLGHLSLIFIERPYDPIHSEHCIQVLKLFRLLMRKNLIFKDNYRMLMKLCMLSFSPILSKVTEFSKKISGELSKTIFEIFLRSEVKDEALWKELCKDFSGWAVNSDAINSWCCVATGLSQRIVNLLYGESTEEILVAFKEEGQIDFKISIEHTIMSWNYIVIQVLENTENSLFDPVTHKDIVKSVAQIVEIFINVASMRTNSKVSVIPKVATENNKKVKQLMINFQNAHLEYESSNSGLPVPTISSLMRIFGNWLLAQSANKGIHVYGQAVAISCLCKIFCKTPGPATDADLGKFYKVIFKGLKFANENNFQVAGSILKYSVKLLTQDHRGVRLLLHKSCIFKVLGSYIMSKDILPNIKKTCYTVLASVVGVSKYYKGMGILPMINECLVFGVSAETEPKNMVSVFWTLCSYVSVVDDSGLLEKLIKSIVNRALSIDCSDKDVFVECLGTISVIPFMMQSPKLVSESVVKDIVSKFLVKILGKFSKGLTDSLYILMLNMLTHWIFKFPNVLRDQGLKNQVFESLSFLKNADRIKEYATYVELLLMNSIGKYYPRLSHRYDNSSIVTRSFLTQDFQSSLKHYLYRGKVLVSFYNTDEYGIVVIRNQIGRYSWKIRPCLGRQSPQKGIKIKIKKTSGPSNLVNPKDNINHFNDETLDISQNILGKIKKSYFSSEQTLKNFKYNKISKPIKKEIVHFNDECYYRSLLAELGYFNNELIEELSSFQLKDINSIIAELDDVNDKEIFIIPIFYLEKPESSEQSLLKKYSEYSSEFIDFLGQMGIFLNESSLQLELFRTVFNLIEKYKNLILYREYYYEIVSLVPAILSNFKGNIDEIIQYNQLIVLWNQRSGQPSTLKHPVIFESSKFKKKTIIMISPLRNNIFRVNIIGSETNCAPLVNNMLLPNCLIAKFICKAIANFYSSSTSRIALCQRRIEIFNQLKTFSKRIEDTKNGKTGAILSYTFNKI